MDSRIVSTSNFPSHSVRSFLEVQRAHGRRKGDRLLFYQLWLSRPRLHCIDVRQPVPYFLFIDSRSVEQHQIRLPPGLLLVPHR